MSRKSFPLKLWCVVIMLCAQFAAAQSKNAATTKVTIEGAPDRAALGSIGTGFARRFEGEFLVHASTRDVFRIPTSRLAEAKAAAASLGYRLTEADDFDVIFLPGRKIDTRSAAKSGHAAGKALHVLQFIAPVQEGWLKAVQAAGATLVQYVPQNAYLVYGDAAAVASLERLPYVQWADVYGADMKGFPFGNAVQVVDVDVLAVAAPETQTLIERIRGASASETTTTGSFGTVTIHCALTLADARLILAEPTVISLAPAPVIGLSDERVAISLTSQVAAGAPTGPGYNSWLTSHCSFCGNLNAEGFVAGVADSGFDTGTPSPIHPDVTGRVTFGANYAVGEGGALTMSDRVGHGTMVGGAIAGNGFTNTTDSGGYLRGMGIAPTAGLFITKITGTGGSAARRTIVDYASDARLHNPPVYFQNHSHNDYQAAAFPGSSIYADGYYTANARDYDLSVRDSNQQTSDGLTPISLIVSAGNIHQAPQTEDDVTNPWRRWVLAPATGKNVLSVGAAENSRPASDLFTGTDIHCTAANDASSFENAEKDSKRGTVPLSSASWLPYIKPDLMAPATVTWNTASSAATSTYCAGVQPSSSQPYYMATGGTSLAAPVATGAALLASRVYAQQVSPTSPSAGLASPALVKAMLIGAAKSMEGGLNRRDGAAIPPRPNESQGFGRVDIQDLLDATTKQYVNQAVTFHSSSDPQWKATYFVSDPAKPVKVALVWTDAAGQPISTNAGTAPSPLVNDLDLSVGRGVYVANPSSVCVVNALGNNMLAGDISRSVSCNETPAPGTIGWDRTNNVELVVLRPGTTGNPGFTQFTVRVNPTNIAAQATPDNSVGAPPANQDFALYVYNARTRGDIDANGKTDIVWRNTSTGQQGFCTPHGSTYDYTLLPYASTTALGGVADLNHDGTDDMILQDPATGAVTWQPLTRSSSGTISAGSIASIGSPLTAWWKLRAVVDVDNDDNPDLIFRNEAAGGSDQGAVVVWLMSGATKRSEVSYNMSPDLSWTLAGAADINGDGNIDFVWRNQSTGADAIWLMSGTQMVGSMNLETVTDPNWTIAALGDYNSDGYNDIVWRNRSDGGIMIWYMTRETHSSSVTLPAVPISQNWEIVGPK